MESDSSFDSSDDEADLLIASMARSRGRRAPIRADTKGDGANAKKSNPLKDEPFEKSSVETGGIDTMDIDTDNREDTATPEGDAGGDQPTKLPERRTRVMNLYEVSPGGSLTPQNETMSEPIAPSVPTRLLRKPPLCQIEKPAKGLSRVMGVEEASPIKTEEEAESQLLLVVAQDIALSSSTRKVPSKKPGEPRDPTAVFVQGVKRLPKYVADTDRLIFPEEWTQKNVHRLKAEAESSRSHQQPSLTDFPLLEASLNSIPDDPFSVSLKVRGRSDLVEKLKKIVESKINKEMVDYNLPALVKDGSSLELDLRLDCSETESRIGALCHSSSTSMNKPGVWITRSVPGSQMHAAVGCATVTGGAILSVDGTKVYKLSHITDAWAKAKENGKVSVVLKVCLNKEADLSEVDASRLVNMTKPRRRDGAVYHGRWNFNVAPVASRRDSNIKPVAKTSVDERTPGKKRKADAASQVDAAATRKKFVTDAGKKHFAAYQNFTGKYHQVKEIEYRPYGIKGQFVNKSMWDRHKLIYGEECDEQCPCPSDLSRLTETVISDFLKRMTTKDRKWANPHGLNARESPVGFVSNFIPKFYDRVKTEFPLLNPSQILKKLELMWEMHRKQLRFGIECKKSCPCGEGWETIFKKQLMRDKSVEGSSVTSKSPLARQASAPVGNRRIGKLLRDKPEDGSSVMPEPPLVRRASAPGANKRMGTLSSGKSLPVVRGKSEADAKEKKGSLLRQMATPSQKQDFNLLFSVDEPLGLYFESEQRREKGVFKTFCKILSISPYAEKRDSRLQVGTIILGTAPWSINFPKEPMKSLRTHLELKTRYEAIKVKNDGSKIRLWFVASDVSPSSLATSRKNDWSSSGAWQGESNTGWPGGAPLAPKTTAKTPQDQSRLSDQKMQSSTLTATVQESTRRQIQGGLTEAVPLAKPTQTPRQVPSTRGPGEEQKSSPSKPVEVEQGDSAKRAALAMQILAASKKADDSLEQLRSKSSGELKVPKPSLLRKKSTGANKSGKQGRRVSFKRNLAETRTYIKDSDLVDQEATTATTVSNPADDGGPPEGLEDVQVPAPKAATVDMDIPIQQRRSDEMTKAILEKDYKEIIHLLKCGAYAQQKDSKKKLPREYTKERLERIGQELKNAHGDYRDKLKRTQKEFHLKDTVLKIFLHAEHVLKMARFMKEWVNVEFVPLQAESLRLTEKGRNHPSSDFVFTVVQIDGHVQEPTMPLIPLNDSPDWTRVQNCPKYYLGYNKEMDFSYKRGRKVKVDLIKGSSKDSGNNIKLGTWEDTVENIKDALDLSGETEVDHELIRSEFLSGASVSVKFRCVPPDSDFLRRKRLEGARDLSTLIDWIENFRKETESDALDANISLPIMGGLSILHAAVYLADLNLVYRLLSLGADPSFLSTEAGSAENLAVNLAESTAVGSRETHGTLIDIMNALKRDVAERKQKSEPNPVEHDDPKKRQQEMPDPPSHNSSDQESSAPGSFNVLRDPRALNQLASKVQSILTEQSTSAMDTGQMQPIQPISTHQTWTPARYQQTPPTSGYSQQTGQHYGYVVPQPHQYGQMQQTYQGYQQYPTHIQTTVTPTHLLPTHTGQPIHDNVSNNTQVERLPKLPVADWIKGRSVRCKNYNRLGGCSLGRNCPNAHVHPPIGIELDNSAWSDHAVMMYNGELWSAKYIHVHPPMMSPTGKTWYTCAYYDKNTNVIYYSERGRSSFLSEQGVYWYPTEGDAIVACKRVVLHALQANSNTNTFNAGLPPPPPPPPPLPPSLHVESTSSQSSRKIIRAEDSEGATHPCHDNTKEYASVFNKLKKGDMQAIYIKIFPGNQLPRSVWKSHRWDGSVTTAFHSPAKEERGAIYYPVGCGGRNVGSKWWYCDEKIAKCSAFLQFLIHKAKSGMVTPDLTGTSDGKRFFKESL